MKVLIVLLGSFALTAGISRLVAGSWNLLSAGNLAMCIMLCFTAIGHVKFMAGMVMMIPEFIPSRKAAVLFTGLLEVLLGLALLLPSLRHAAGMGLMILLVVLLPANIHAAFRHINMEQASYSGPGPSYLWFRIPLQLLFLAWVWFFSVSNGACLPAMH